MEQIFELIKQGWPLALKTHIDKKKSIVFFLSFFQMRLAKTQQ